MHTVADKQSLDAILKRYGALEDKEKVIELNGLESDGAVYPGQTLYIAGGNLPSRPEPEPEPEIKPTRRLASASTTTRRQSTSRSSSRNSNSSRSYRSGGSTAGIPWGWCTWYAAKEFGGIGWRGNAGTWYNNAASAGYKTGQTPQAGALFVTSESGWGHTGIIRKVNGDSITVEEMNYKGFGVVSTRTINKNNPVIKGYIYK